MNPNVILKRFYEDATTRETLKGFFEDILADMALDAVFEGKSVLGFPESKRLIDQAFNKLDEMYGIIKDKEPETSR